MQNRDIKLFARGAGVPLWKLAKALGVSEPTLTRRLRMELSKDEKKRIHSLINELSKEG